MEFLTDYRPKKKYKIENLSGRRFGRLIVTGFAGITTDKKYAWHCACDCGKKTAVRGETLKSGNTTSCGCLAIEKNIARLKTHGMRDSSEFTIWSCMRDRCTRKKNRAYERYGGRGITVCERWNKFENFFEDMGPRPSKLHSIDRIDNNGGYCKENCRWATIAEQSANTRSNRMIEYNGKSLHVAEWSRLTGFSESLIRHRLKRGWTTEKALTCPVGSSEDNRVFTTLNGSKMLLIDAAKILGISYFTAWARIKRSGSVELSGERSC